MKGGGQAIYLEFVVIGQLLPAANPDPSINLETHVFQDSQVLLYVPVYNKAAGMYGGLTKKLARITLRGDANDRFYSYGYSKEKITLLYCTMKHPLPNIFIALLLRNIMGFYLMKTKRKLTSHKMIFTFFKMMKKVAEISNQNLVRNSDAYISNGGKIDPDNEFSWIDDSYKQGKEKFQLSY